MGRCGGGAGRRPSRADAPLSLLLSVAAVGATLGAVLLAGRLAAIAILPSGPGWGAETFGWSLALGAALLAGETTAALVGHLSFGWVSFLLAAAVVAGLALRWRLPGAPADGARAPREERLLSWRWWLVAPAAGGVCLYLLRALTEPMWSNDYLAIWGLKGKSIFLARALPGSLWPAGLYDFAHPEYPLGLPLLYAGLASLLGRWDDHAMALLFPCLQVATLVVLFGWLKRRGTSWQVSMGAVALVALFEPLYSGFLTGMAEVPVSAAFLLFGTAFSDCLDADGGSPIARSERPWRRLAAASLIAAATKNEGIFLCVAGGVGALAARGRSGLRTAAVALVPAGMVAVASRLASGGAPLRDLDFAFLGPRIRELPARAEEALRATVATIDLPAWAALACLALLLLAGRRTPFADRLLVLAAVCLAAYLALPALSARGPAWLVQALPRTAAALAPLVAAGLAGRLGAATRQA